MAVIYKGDIGTKIKLNAGVDISTANEVKIKYIKPNGVKGEWPAEVEGTQYAYYNMQAGDLNVAGKYNIQLYVDLGDWKGCGRIITFIVEATVMN